MSASMSSEPDGFLDVKILSKRVQLRSNTVCLWNPSHAVVDTPAQGCGPSKVRIRKPTSLPEIWNVD